MADKTIGLSLDQWRSLKQIALDRDCTLGQAVEFLIESLEAKGKANGKDVEKPGKDADGNGGKSGG